MAAATTTKNVRLTALPPLLLWQLRVLKRYIRYIWNHKQKPSHTQYR